MSALSDIGKAESQPVSVENRRHAEESYRMLAEIANLKGLLEAQRRAMDSVLSDRDHAEKMNSYLLDKAEAENARLKATIEAQQRQLRALCGKEETQTHKWGEDWFISSAIDTFLNEERFISDLVLSCDMVAGSLAVVCSDVFAWGCADAEPIDGDEESLTELARYMMENAKWGSTQWACKKRNQQPQAPVAEAMKREGAWPKFMDCLSPNKYDANRAEQMALRGKPA